MKDKANLTPAGTTEHPPIQASRRQRTYCWLKRRRSTLAFHFLRGIAYGSGASGVGIILWWIENH